MCCFLCWQLHHAYLTPSLGEKGGGRLSRRSWTEAQQCFQRFWKSFIQTYCTHQLYRLSVVESNQRTQCSFKVSSDFTRAQGLPVLPSPAYLRWPQEQTGQRLTHIGSTASFQLLMNCSSAYNLKKKHRSFSRKVYYILRTFIVLSSLVFRKRKRFLAPGANSWDSANFWEFRSLGFSARSELKSMLLNPNMLRISQLTVL